MFSQGLVREFGYSDWKVSGRANDFSVMRQAFHNRFCFII